MIRDIRYINGMPVANANDTGGQSGGSYTPLTDKPQIDGVELVGNKTAEALGLTSLDIYREEVTNINNQIKNNTKDIDTLISQYDHLNINKVDLDLSNVKVNSSNSGKSLNVDSNGNIVYLDKGINFEDFNTRIDVGSGHLEDSYINLAMVNKPEGTPEKIILSSGGVPISFETNPIISDLHFKNNESKINIYNNNKEVGINYLFVKQNEDMDTITLSSSYAILELNDFNIVLIQGNNRANLSFVEGQLAINGKKILTEA